MTAAMLISSGLYLAQGALVTIGLSFGMIAVATVAGMLLALLRLYSWKPLGLLAAAYGLVARGVPLLVLLIGSYFACPTWASTCRSGWSWC